MSERCSMRDTFSCLIPSWLASATWVLPRGLAQIAQAHLLRHQLGRARLDSLLLLAR